MNIPKDAEITVLMDLEMERIADNLLVKRVQSLRVKPHPVEREWDYGKPGERYVCWTVLEHAESNTGIAYCFEGFGPSSPWGIVYLAGEYMSIGMDYSWYSCLEDAVRESMAWEGANPEGYEVQ